MTGVGMCVLDCCIRKSQVQLLEAPVGFLGTVPQKQGGIEVGSVHLQYPPHVDSGDFMDVGSISGDRLEAELEKEASRMTSRFLAQETGNVGGTYP